MNNISAEPGRADQEGHLLRRLLERGPVGRVPLRVERARRRHPQVRRARRELPLARVLEVDQAHSNALFKGSLALLPATERVLVEQLDWSEEKNINPYAVFDKPPATVEVTPNIGRRGQTGHRGHRLELHSQCAAHHGSLRRAGRRKRCPRRCRRTSGLIVRHPREREQRQPDRRDDRRQSIPLRRICRSTTRWS